MEDLNASIDIEQKMLMFSLLWKDNNHKTDFFEIDKEAYHDLNLDKIINFINPDSKKQSYIINIFTKLSMDPDLINFRVSILEDFINNDKLTECIKKIMPNLDALSSFNDYFLNNMDEKILLHDVSWRLYVLDNYITCIIALNELYDAIKDNIRSEGLQYFFEFVKHVISTGSFINCKDELPELIDKISNIKSITIGINLDFKLSPVEATLMSINDKKIEKQNIFNKLFSGETIKRKSTVYSLYTKGFMGNIDYQNPGTIKNLNIKLNQLFNELSGMLYGVIKPIEDELRRFTGIKTRLLAKLKNEFQYYIDISIFMKNIMKTGLPMCKPEIFDKEKRIQLIKNNYNINLAIHLMSNENKKDVNDIIVKNDVKIDDEGRILIITGPNQGGKTTYLNAIGISQVFAQSGLYIPGTKATMCVFDNILTHFPLEEKPDKLEGRLGEEAKRLNLIFEKVTCYSLVLLNESLTSTSPGESVYLARDLMKIFRIIGSIVVYTTHLHELAMQIDEINNVCDGDSKLISMVSMVIEDKKMSDNIKMKFIRSFKIIPGKPLGNSYAREIALKHGIDFDQLKNKMLSRGIIK